MFSQKEKSATLEELELLIFSVASEVFQKEKDLLSQHRTFQQQEWENSNNNLKSIIRDNNGIWLSSKVNWWAIAIFELLFCLAAYFDGNALIATVR